MPMKKQYLRCFAEYSGGVWVAYCVDLGLGAQSNDYDDARTKLEAQIRDLSPEEARMLLTRGAPFWLHARYWLARVIVAFARAVGHRPVRRKRFRETFPPGLVPC